MAFTSSKTGQTVEGNSRMTYGTFTNGAGDSGGNIDTGLPICDMIILGHSGAAAVASSPAVNETLPVAGAAVTIVTTTGADGHWIAFGH